MNLSDYADKVYFGEETGLEGEGGAFCEAEMRLLRQADRY